MNDIVQQEDLVLHQAAAEVGEAEFGTAELQTLIQNMTDALNAQKDGVAIAAPQIGVSKRIFIVRYDRLISSPPETPLPADVGVYINPEFVRSARKRELMDEGCLSVRGVYGKTYRHVRATVRACQSDGRLFERGGGGLLAQIFQHEIDHLEGVLFIDHAVDIYRVNDVESN